MLFKSISYLLFLLKSTNQHGVHSPFVFSFVTKGLYIKKYKCFSFRNYHQLKNVSKKKKKFFSKILYYFKIESIELDFLNFKNNKNNNFKALYISDLKDLLELNLAPLTSKHFILVDGIYADKKANTAWKNIINNENVTVSIDLFYFGLLFFRKEQAKEHFTIRT